MSTVATASLLQTGGLDVEAAPSQGAHDEAEAECGQDHDEQGQREPAPRVAALVVDHLGRQRGLQQQRGERELAQHHRRRQAGRSDHRGAHVRQEHAEDDRAQARAHAARGLVQRARVDRLQAGVEGAVGERHRPQRVERARG